MHPEDFWCMIPSEFIKWYKSQVDALVESEKRENTRTALICTTIANFVPMRSKKSKTYKVKDFMPKERKKPQTTEQMDAEIDKIGLFFGIKPAKRGEEEWQQ